MLMRTEIRGQPGGIFEEIEIYANEMGPPERSNGRRWREATAEDNIEVLHNEGKAVQLYWANGQPVWGVLL
jgi:hypothetical protein